MVKMYLSFLEKEKEFLEITYCTLNKWVVLWGNIGTGNVKVVVGIIWEESSMVELGNVKFVVTGVGGSLEDLNVLGAKRRFANYVLVVHAHQSPGGRYTHARRVVLSAVVVAVAVVVEVVVCVRAVMRWNAPFALNFSLTQWLCVWEDTRSVDPVSADG